jgi:broad specificity phosphatase PhoE
VAQRLLVVAHGPTAGVREAIFGDLGHLADAAAIGPIAARVAWWRHGPEPACVETATRLGGPGEATARLATCDFGSWTGRSLAAVGAEDPEAVGQWLADPRARPHGGESLSELVSRVGPAVDHPAWPDGQSIVVVTPLVARALVVHALGGPPEMIFRIDVAPLGRVKLSRRTNSWRLRFDRWTDV